MIYNEIKSFTGNKILNKPIFVSGSIGRLDLYKKIILSKFPFTIEFQSYIDDHLENYMKKICKKNYIDSKLNKQLKEEVQLLEMNISSIDLKRDISGNFLDSKDYLSPLYYINISNINVNHKTFSGEVLIRICQHIRDGIIVYFSNENLLEEYVKIWNDQNVFDSILNKKLCFIEESNSYRMSIILANFKKSCDSGRGGILFLTMKNRTSNKKLDLLHGNYSKALIFIGFPIDLKICKRKELFMSNLKKEFDIDFEEYLNYDIVRNFSVKISEKILNSDDKKILLILDDRITNEKYSQFLPNWIRKIINNHSEKESKNTEERIMKAKRFLEFNNDIEKK